MLSARFILSLSFTLIAIALSGCRTEYIEQSGAEVNSTNPSASSLITKPGVVAVDAPARLKELTDAGALRLCLSITEGSIPDVLHDLKAPPDYGLDDRYLKFSDYFRNASSACLRRHIPSCANIQRFALNWARTSKLGHPPGTKKQAVFWNSTLSINLRLLGPMVAALGVAEQITPLSKSDKEAIDSWLKNKVDQYEHGMRNDGNFRGGDDGTTARRAAHNHAIQSSIAAMSYGAWVNNEKYFKTGIEQWNITLKTMRKDGSLPIETRRGARALFYTGRALSALVQLAERAAVQGIDLYNSAPNSNKTIHHAVKFFIDAMEQPELVVKYARTNFAPGPSNDYKYQDLGGMASSPFGWIQPYMAQFPEHPNTRRLLARQSADFSGIRNRLTNILDVSVSSHSSNGWTGVDATCFYANPEFI